MQYFHDVLSLTATATGLFDALDLVGFTDDKVTADDAPVKGIAKHPATEIGLDVALLAIGIARVRARGIVTKGDRLMSAAAGGVKKIGASPVNDFAWALTTAADGEFVTILVR